METSAIYPAAPAAHVSDLPANRLVTGILIASTAYQAVLCLIHTHFFPASPALVGLAELSIYLACVPLLLRQFPPGVLATIVAIGASITLMTLLRNAVDLKPLRDLAIPVLFYWLGRNAGSIDLADRILKQIVLLVLVAGLFELLLPNVFTQIFNIFSYYVSQGGITVDTNFISDSRLQLNGLRPEGIGRTILPVLFGSHRISSIFLEPVSLGNFAVITAAWGFAKPREEIRTALFFIVSAAVLIALSDSRYGLLMFGLLFALRLSMVDRLPGLAILFPFMSILFLLALAVLQPDVVGDNIVGRLTTSGRALTGFDMPMILGITGSNINFGDMGYAYVLTRFGLFLALYLWLSLWLIPVSNSTGTRFRVYLALYIALILCVSGTSLFALKTAGLAWFLLGTVADRMPRLQPAKLLRKPIGRQYAQA
ncbi:MAG TPA: hypothetical protein VFW00_00285 [Rhodocyclaceae bacterium]|nr:hypothetical protein [Rhodocyclaceae bacterium]